MIELNQSWAGPYHRMPLELPKDRAAMIAKAIEADDGACSTGAMMADPAPVAAKPSLLDELAEVARRAWYASDSTTPGMIRDWDKVPAHHQEWWRAAALAVARRLLEREPSEGEVSEACDAYLMFKEPEKSVVVNLRRMEDALKASRRAQLAELEERA